LRSITNLTTGERVPLDTGIPLIEGQDTLKEGFLYLIEATDMESAIEYERIINVLPDTIGDYFDVRMEYHQLN
jgi:hypothetical protein